MKSPETVLATKRAVSDRWSPALAVGGFTPVVNFFLENYHRLKMKHSEAMFVIHLVSFKWEATAPYPGFKTLGKAMGISSQAARNIARTLERKQLLRREFSKGDTNRFHLNKLFNALEALAKKDAEAVTRPPRRLSISEKIAKAANEQAASKATEQAKQQAQKGPPKQTAASR